MDTTCIFKRIEKKYLLTEAQYERLFQRIGRHLKPDKFGRSTVMSLYLDTPDHRIIRNSIEAADYKEKLRMRSYGVPGWETPVFVEIKKKFEGVVYKRRITMRMQDAARYLGGVQKGDGSQISREIDYFMQLYRPQPRAFIAYDREAYAAADGGELRITFDTALRARSNDLDLRAGDHGVLLLGEDYYLMEVKIPGSVPLWLARLLSENGIFSTSFSKYGAYYKQFVLSGRSAVTYNKEVLLSA
jgi:hypothetical protein